MTWRPLGLALLLAAGCAARQPPPDAAMDALAKQHQRRATEHEAVLQQVSDPASETAEKPAPASE